MGGEAFRSLLEDPYANSEDLQERFTPFGYEAFLQSLRTRQDIGEEDAQRIASRLEGIMNNVRADAEGLQSAARARVDNQWQSLQHYLQKHR